MDFDASKLSPAGLDHRALLLASWLFGMCWALMALQTYSYYRRYQRDPWLLKAGVGILFAAETAWTTIIFITAYNQLVDADTSSLPSLLPSTLLAYAPVASVVTVMCVNVYLISRLYALSKQLWLSVSLLVLSAAAFGCFMWSIVLFVDLSQGSYRYLESARTATIVGLSMQIAAIALIGALLLLYLLRFLGGGATETRRILVRVILITVHSGLATTVLAVLSLVYFVYHPTSNNTVLVGGCTGRVYAFTMLANLHSRGSTSHLMRDNSAYIRAGHDGVNTSQFSTVDGPSQYLTQHSYTSPRPPQLVLRHMEEARYSRMGEAH